MRWAPGGALRAVPHTEPPQHAQPCQPQCLGLPGCIPAAGDLCSPPAWMGGQQLPLLIILVSPELSTAGLVPLAMAAAAEKAAICSSLFVFCPDVGIFLPSLQARGIQPVPAFPQQPLLSPPAPCGDFPSPSPRLGRAEPPSDCQR